MDTIQGFGEEWSKFDQSAISPTELKRIFRSYFDIFPFNSLPDNAVGFDLGAGSGRWAKLVAPNIGHLHIIEPSKAIEIAKQNVPYPNVTFHQADVDHIPLEDESCDFGYSLGVLHHIKDPEDGMRKCVAKLKTGAPFLVYLYYRFDNKPAWFRAIWKVTDIMRQGVSRLPFIFRYWISQVIAALIYFPLARLALIFPFLPLSQYRYNSFYIMRNDALDRFGTRIEHRFTKQEIRDMMTRCGLRDISFSEVSQWTAIGYRK